MHANTDPVKFDFGMADTLVSSFRYCRTSIENQMGERENAIKHALEEFKGNYADLFTKNTRKSMQHAHELIEALRNAEENLKKYIEAAHEEERIRREIKEWEEQEESKRSHGGVTGASGTFNLNKDKKQMSEPPRNTEPPNYSNYVSDSARSRGGFASGLAKDLTEQVQSNPKLLSQGTVSGIPANLFEYYEKITTLNPEVEKNQGALEIIYEVFIEGTEWGVFDAVALITAVKGWIADTYTEAGMALKASEELWKAGSNGDLSASNPNLSNPYEVHTVDTHTIIKSIGDLSFQRYLAYVPSAQITGGVPSSGYKNDPVNIATGNFIEPEVDLAFDHTSARSLKLKRMYNSVAVVHKHGLPSGVFGPGWSSTLDAKLVFSNQEAQWYTDDGRILCFPRQDNKFERAPGEPWWIEKIDSENVLYERIQRAHTQAWEQTRPEESLIPDQYYWVISNEEHVSHAFTPSGFWLSTTIGHPSNTVVALRRNNLITEIIHPAAGRGIHIDYSSYKSGTTTRPLQAYTYNTIGSHANIPLFVAEYGYNTHGHLVSVATAAGIRSYSHTPEHLIHEVTDVNGHVEVTNTYDQDGRVVHQLSEYDYEISYQYLADGKTVIAGKNAGIAPNIFYSDAKGRLVSTVASDGTRYTMRYNSFNKRVSETYRDGTTVARSYDTRGRLVKERTPEGTDYTYRWDEHDRITDVSVRDARDTVNLGPSMTVTYEYADDTNPNPVALTDATGAVTRYEWNDQGYPTRITDPTGVINTFEYDEHGDLIAVSDGLGNTVSYTRDAQGRIIRTTNPLGYASTIRYNESGVPVSFEEPSGARWTLIYPQVHTGSHIPTLIRNPHRTEQSVTMDGLTQGLLPSALTDPYGNTTMFTYNRANDITSVTDPLGHTLQNIYDVRGNLTQIVDSNGGTWNYVYDGLSQLVEATDPSGAVTRYSYDLNGELSSVTDATGVEIKRRVDRQRGIEEIADAFSSSFIHTDIFGRVTSEQKRARGGSSATKKTDVESEFITYDAAGRPVEILDAAGGLTRCERDGAGRVLRVISAEGRIETYDYDAAGRVISHAVGLDAPERYTDEEGVSQVVEPSAWAITRLEYDAASQIIKRINPDGTVEKITYDMCGRVTGVEAGARVASYEYDLCGRLIGVRDSSFGQRRFKYDAAGQIIHATDGLGFRTHFSYTATGQVCRVVDAAGQVTDYEYDALDRLVRVIKAAGTDDESVQEYAYDAAGRLIRAHDGVREYTHTYDYAAGGRLSHTCVDGVKAAEFGVEDQGRTVWVRDYASAQALDGNASEDAFVQHRFVYDARGLLMERSRSGVITDTAGACSGTADVDAQVQVLNTFTNTGAYTLTLGYDADGYRTRMVTPYGETAIAHDGAGRVVSMSRADQDAHRESPAAQYSYDAMGRLIRAQLGDILSRWEFDDVSGLVCSYSRENTAKADSVERTEVIRDEQGRIVGLDSADGLVVYTYDAAGQLTGSRSGDLEFEWVFEAGLMVSERTWRHSGGTGESEEPSRVLSGERSFAYNRLNQLTEIIAIEYAAAIAPEFAGLHREVINRTVTTYEYNAAGERTRAHTASNTGLRSTRDYDWDVFGALSTVTDTVSSDAFHANPLGITGFSSRVRLVTDATGDLAQVTDTAGVSIPLVWDPDAAMPQILGAGGVPAPGSDGGFSQVGTAGSFDPWAVPPILGSAPVAQGMNIPGLPHALSADDSGVWESMLPDGFSFTGAGSVRVAGLDMMGARVFDGVSKRFLSTDPLAQVPGTGFFADVYAFCGNNPVGLMDPWGTREVSNELARDTSFEGWANRNAQELKIAFIAGAATIAIVTAPFTGGTSLIAGGAAIGGMMAVSSSIDQNMDENGRVAWGKVGIDGIKGAVEGMILGGLLKGAQWGYKTFKGSSLAAQGMSKVQATREAVMNSRALAGTRQVVSSSKQLAASGYQSAKSAMQMVYRGARHVPAAAAEYTPQVWNTTKNAATLGLREGREIVHAIPQMPMVQYGRNLATLGASKVQNVANAVPRVVPQAVQTVKGVARVGAQRTVDLAKSGASTLKSGTINGLREGREIVHAIPQMPMVQYGRNLVIRGAQGGAHAAKAGWNLVNSGARMAAPVAKNAAVNAATGAAVNAGVYAGQRGIEATVQYAQGDRDAFARAYGRDWDWDKFNTYVGSGATGNVLGGLVKPTVGSLSRGQLSSGMRNTVEAMGAGGLNVANAQGWSLATGQGPLSGGDTVYALLAGAGASQMGSARLPYKKDKGQWVKFEDTVAGRPLKAPEYVDSFAALRAGHPNFHGNPGWLKLGNYGAGNAGTVALTDLAKTYLVDPGIKLISTLPVNSGPSDAPGPSPVSPRGNEPVFVQQPAVQEPVPDPRAGNPAGSPVVPSPNPRPEPTTSSEHP